MEENSGDGIAKELHQFRESHLDFGSEDRDLDKINERYNKEKWDKDRQKSFGEIAGNIAPDTNHTLSSSTSCLFLHRRDKL